MNKIKPIIRVQKKTDLDYRGDRSYYELGIGYYESEVYACCGKSTLYCLRCLVYRKFLNSLRSSLKKYIRIDKNLCSKVNEKKLRHIDIYNSIIYNNIKRIDEYNKKINKIEKTLI